MPSPLKHVKQHHPAEESDNDDYEANDSPKKVVRFVWSAEVNKAFTQIKRKSERKRSTFWDEVSNQTTVPPDASINQNDLARKTNGADVTKSTDSLHLKPPTTISPIHKGPKRDGHNQSPLSVKTTATTTTSKRRDSNTVTIKHENKLDSCNGFVVQISKLPQLYSDMISMRRRKGRRKSTRSVATSALSRISMACTSEHNRPPSATSSSRSGTFTPSPEHQQRTALLLARIPRESMAYTKKTFKSSRNVEVCNYPMIHMIEYPGKHVGCDWRYSLPSKQTSMLSPRNQEYTLGHYNGYSLPTVRGWERSIAVHQSI